MSVRNVRRFLEELEDVSREFSTDSTSAIIYPRAFMHFGFDSALGKKLICQTSSRKDHEIYRIIGIVEDFHFDSFRNNIEQLILFLGRSKNLISFQIQIEDISATIDLLRREWEKFLPDEPFEYSLRYE